MATEYSLTGNLQAAIQATLSATDDAGIITRQSISGRPAAASWTLDDTSGEADDAVVINSTLGAGASETWDLAEYENTLKNAFGISITWQELQGVLFIPDSGNSDTMSIGGATDSCFKEAQAVPAGGILMWYAGGTNGITLTTGSSDGIKITNNNASGSATYNLILIGIKDPDESSSSSSSSSSSVSSSSSSGI